MGGTSEDKKRTAKKRAANKSTANKSTAKKRARMNKVKLMVDLMDEDVKEHLSEKVTTARYKHQLKQARIYTDKMVKDILGNKRLEYIVANEWCNDCKPSEKAEISKLSDEIFDKPEYKKNAIEYIRDNMKLPDEIKYYFSVLLYYIGGDEGYGVRSYFSGELEEPYDCTWSELVLSMLAPSEIALSDYEYGQREWSDSRGEYLKKFVHLVRDGRAMLEISIENAKEEGEEHDNEAFRHHFVGSGDIHKFFDLSDLDRENYLHIFLSHFVFKDDFRASLKKQKKQKKKKKKSRRKRQNTR